MPSVVDYVGANSNPEVVVGTTSSDFTRNNSAAAADVTGAAIWCKPNSRYLVHLHVVYRATAAADMVLSFTYPTGCTIDWTDTSQPSSSGTLKEETDTDTLNGDDAVDRYYQNFLIVCTGSTGGLVQLRNAQLAAGATDFIIRKGGGLFGVRAS